MRTSRSILAVGAAGVLLLAGCGTDQNEPEPVEREAAEQAQYLTWRVTQQEAPEVYTVVYDSSGSTTEIVTRSPSDGSVQAKFGSGSPAAAAFPLADGSVGQVAGDTLEVFTGGQQSGSYPVTIPGQSEAPYLSDLVAGPGGTWVMSGSVGDGVSGVPDWLGVASVSADGKTLGTWTVPADSSLPENAFILPASVSTTPSGTVFVRGIPCQAGMCGSPVIDTGWIYQLDVAADGTITLAQEWSDSSLADGQWLTMIDETSFFALGASGAGSSLQGYQLQGSVTDAYEFVIDGDAITQQGKLAADDIPTYIGMNRTGSGPDAYVLQYTGGYDGSYSIQPFSNDSGTWTKQGDAWPASWGSGGPS